MSEKKNRIYIAIDLKSFYASVECVDRGLDPLAARLVVADESRTEKTICLAVSPALKAYGIPGRARLFEVVQKVKQINADKRAKKETEIDYIVAKPQMARYMQVSKDVYKIYLHYIAPEDIHVYSIDEVFMDVTDYLHTYNMTARELTVKIIHEVLDKTGVTATAGIGTNLYLCKIAMDVEAKHVAADKDGVRIAELDEMSYRRKLWNHEPLTDFWRVGRGTAKKLNDRGIYTMGDIARVSVGKPSDFFNEDMLYRLFGVNAELLIDHAWGWEPCTIKDIKGYRPQSKSISQGQVLSHPYDFNSARLIIKEMADNLSLDLVRKGFITDQIVLTVGYDTENALKGLAADKTLDWYGRVIPKHAHGTINLDRKVSSSTVITKAAAELFDSIVNPSFTIRRMYIVAENVVYEQDYEEGGIKQLDLFTDYTACEENEKHIKEELVKENSMQKTILDIKARYGKNAILKGMNFEQGATARERNDTIGGHKA